MRFLPRLGLMFPTMGPGPRETWNSDFKRPVKHSFRLTVNGSHVSLKMPPSVRGIGYYPAPQSRQ